MITPPPDALPNPPPQDCLAATALVDSGHPAIQAFANQVTQAATLANPAQSSQRAHAVALYYAVRDGFRYDPYRTDLRPDGIKASKVITNGYGWCVPKAALLAAACRAAGIPARLGYADVRNHLSTAKMRESMTTDVFAWHGYTDIWLDGAWRKATPAFNIELCDRFGLLPLEFDGVNDSIYHPFDKSGQRHMEYLRQRGAYVEMPLAQIMETFRDIYPNWVKADTDQNSAASGSGTDMAQGDFEADVARETGAR